MCVCGGVSTQGDVCQGVSAWGLYAQGVSVQGGVYPGGCLPRGCLPGGCLSRDRLPSGVCLPDPPPLCEENHRQVLKLYLAATMLRTVIIRNSAHKINMFQMPWMFKHNEASEITTSGTFIRGLRVTSESPFTFVPYS